MNHWHQFVMTGGIVAVLLLMLWDQISLKQMNAFKWAIWFGMLLVLLVCVWADELRALVAALWRAA